MKGIKLDISKRSKIMALMQFHRGGGKKSKVFKGKRDFWFMW